MFILFIFIAVVIGGCVLLLISILLLWSPMLLLFTL